MKRHLLFYALTVTCLTGMAQGNFTVSGNIKGAEGKRIYLNTRKNDVLVKDSVESADGNFSFSPSISEPTVYSLTVQGVRIGGITVFATSSTHVTVDANTADLFSATVTGSAESELYSKIGKLVRNGSITNEIMQKYSELKKKGDTVAMKQMDEEFSKKGKEMIASLKKELGEHTDSYASICWFANMLNNFPMDEVTALYQKYAPAQQNSSFGNIVKKKIDVEAMLAIGKVAPDFEQNDVNGNPMKLSALRGKYVLVDFWASWCKPCRAENPNVVKNYTAYKDKNFTVLGVSLDQPGKKDDWVQAIADDGLTWNHVSDLKYWNNAVAKQYGIQSIPANLLLDPDGKIIARNVRGEDLEKTLEKTIK